MEPSDADLVVRFVATRDEAAFGALIVRHQARVRNWLRQLVRDATRADDLAQDAFIRAWQRIGSLRDPAKFSSWLMSIAYTTFLQARRKRLGENRLLEALQREPESMDAAEPSGANADLPKLLAVLNDDERAAMTLCYAHGMTHNEIAEITALPLGTVKSHISRGKAKIRTRFGIGDEDES
jgi:RNA polymerase sigma-70 factor (ECF subfamily)